MITLLLAPYAFSADAFADPALVERAAAPPADPAPVAGPASVPGTAPAPVPGTASPPPLAETASSAPPQRHRFAPTAMRLDVRIASGDVSVRSDPDVPAPEVRVVPMDRGCAVARDTSYGPSLSVEGCTARVEIVVPRSLVLGLTVGEGDVTLATSANVRVSVGRGDVRGTANGHVRVRVEEGDVALAGLTVRPKVHAGRGTVTLAYLDAR